MEVGGGRTQHTTVTPQTQVWLLSQLDIVLQENISCLETFNLDIDLELSVAKLHAAETVPVLTWQCSWPEGGGLLQLSELLMADFF